MKKILFILPLFLMVFVSCRGDKDKISRLENIIEEQSKRISELETLNDSINSEYEALKDKMTKHIKYVYTVYDEVINSPEGLEWDLAEFCRDYIRENYTNVDLVGMFDISHEDVEGYWPSSDYTDDYTDDDDIGYREPRAL